MTRFRFAALLLGMAAIVAVSGVQAQDKKDNKKPGGGIGGIGRLNAATGPLVPDNLQDKLSLTAEQKGKIKELHEGFAPKYRAQRDQRRELRQKELDALSALLTADQREKVKELVGDQLELPKTN